ncbi:MAG: hypothetical protein JXR70_04945 [Spirochaetales bacterium]|nr:hypothetical protein [Spirochaetales bacterium]
MKKAAFFIIFLILALGAAAQPKVAVLDAVIHSGVKEAVQVPVTQNIIQELVASGKYTVLDRANVARSLEELEFQVSGVVKDTEIKRLGDFLGAEFIVIIDISIIEDIYFVSAKLIDVESTVIKNQVSHKDRGDIDVIFDIASAVGKKLAGKDVKDSFVAKDTTVEASSFATAGDLTVDFGDEGVTFYIYDVVVSGMMGKKVTMEFQLSQGPDWLSGTLIQLDPIEVIYDPSYWNGEAFWFYYPYSEFYKEDYGDYTKDYWGSFFVVKDNGDDLIQKDIQFNVYEHMADAYSDEDSSASASGNYDYDYDDEYDDFSTDNMVSRIVVSYNWPQHLGSAASYFDEILEEDYEASSYLNDYTSHSWDLDLHCLLAIDDGFYLCGNIGLTVMDHEYIAGPNEGETSNVMIGTTVEAGCGTGFSLDEVFQMFLGARVGMAGFVLGDYLSDEESEQSTLLIALETGMDLFVDVLALSGRLDLEYAPFIEGDVFSEPRDMFRINLTVGAGLALR